MTTEDTPSSGRLTGPGVPREAAAPRAEDLLRGELASMLHAWIRQRRGAASDWTMRTSELAGASIAGVVRATAGSAETRSRGEFLSLVRRVVDGVVADRIRRLRVRRRGLEWLHAQGRTAGAAPAGDDGAAEVVDRLLGTLTPEEFELVQLVLEGHGWDEIAARMGVGNSTVRARWVDLRSRLRTMVETMLRERRN